MYKRPRTIVPLKIAIRSSLDEPRSRIIRVSSCHSRHDYVTEAQTLVNSVLRPSQIPPVRFESFINSYTITALWQKSLCTYLGDSLFFIFCIIRIAFNSLHLISAYVNRSHIIFTPKPPTNLCSTHFLSFVSTVHCPIFYTITVKL